MTNFARTINDFATFQNRIHANAFLRKVNDELVQTGQAFLAFRNDEATIYYHGNQLCNLTAASNYTPTIYNHYLPIIRSRTLRDTRLKGNYSEREWRDASKITALSFEDVFDEILDNIVKEQSPESLQTSRFYRFSPLNQKENHEIVLLDVESAFSFAGEKTDRIDLVFYHTIERRLMFVEVKRLSDSRLYDKENAQGQIIKSAEIIEQLTRYRNRLVNERQQVNAQYNNVISYYNTLSGRNLPLVIEDSEPLLGLLLVEFTRSAKDQINKKFVQDLLKKKEFKMYAIGNTSNMTQDSTLAAIYKSFK